MQFVAPGTLAEAVVTLAAVLVIRHGEQLRRPALVRGTDVPASFPAASTF